MTWINFVIHSLTHRYTMQENHSARARIFCLTGDHFYPHDNGILHNCVFFTDVTHSTTLFSCYFNKVTDVSHFCAQQRCCISAVSLANVEAGHCFLPEQTQLQVKRYTHSFYLHSPAASNIHFLCPQYSIIPRLNTIKDTEHLKDATQLRNKEKKAQLQNTIT